MKLVKIATVACAAVVAACAVAGCGTTNIVTVSQPAPSKSTASNADAAGVESTHRELAVGGSATLSGEQSGERLEATLLEYKETISAGEYDTPESGMKFVGVTLKLRNLGTTPYSDSPSNGATILTSSGHQGKVAVIASGECSEGFTASVKIAPGESQEGCIAFELPQEDSAAKFQWTPSSGFGEETAEWSLTRSSTSPPRTTAHGTSAPNATGATAVVENYWHEIKEGNYAAAWGDETASERGGESTFVDTEKEAEIESVSYQFSAGQVSGNAATVNVVELRTVDKQYGCRNWSGSYELQRENGGWLISKANLEHSGC